MSLALSIAAKEGLVASAPALIRAVSFYWPLVPQAGVFDDSGGRERAAVTVLSPQRCSHLSNCWQTSNARSKSPHKTKPPLPCGRFFPEDWPGIGALEYLANLTLPRTASKRKWDTIKHIISAFSSGAIRRFPTISILALSLAPSLSSQQTASTITLHPPDTPIPASVAVCRAGRGD